MTNTPNAELSPEVVKTANEAYCVYSSKGHTDRLIAALQAALPLLEAEIREKVLRDMAAWYETFPETCGFGHGVARYAFEEHNLDLTTDSKNGEG